MKNFKFKLISNLDFCDETLKWAEQIFFRLLCLKLEIRILELKMNFATVCTCLVLFRSCQMMHSFTGELETEFNYGDVDSGNSTNHSPNEDKNISQATEGKTFFIVLEPSFGSVTMLTSCQSLCLKISQKSQLTTLRVNRHYLKVQFRPFLARKFKYLRK